MDAKYPVPPSDKILAMSCTNVGVGPGGTTAMLASVIRILRLPLTYITLPSRRVSIVDYRGEIILDTYVSPTMQVSDYRTATTGIEPSHLLSREFLIRNLTLYSFVTSADTPTFTQVQQLVVDLIKGKVLVGHSLWNDLSGEHRFHPRPLLPSFVLVLGIPHPAVATRDVALYQPFRNALRSPNQVIGLQTLMWHLMYRRCQDGQLHPVSSWDDRCL